MANAKRGSELKMVNWWSAIDGLVRFPLLPPPKRVYANFEGRRFTVPVLHVRKTQTILFMVRRKISREVSTENISNIGMVKV